MKLIAIEGSVGTGKSTLLPKLVSVLNSRNESGNWMEIQEPVNDPEFLRLLNEFTKNPTDSSKRIKFQLYITDRRSELMKNLPEGYNFIIERSLYSDIVFCQTNFLSMETPDAKYMDYFYYIKKKLEDYPRVNALVYLKSDPYKSYNRMLERGRAEEAGTPYEYFMDLEAFHVACLPQICRNYKTPYIEIDWTDFGDVEDLAKKIEYTLAYQDQACTW